MDADNRERIAAAAGARAMLRMGSRMGTDGQQGIWTVGHLPFDVIQYWALRAQKLYACLHVARRVEAT